MLFSVAVLAENKDPVFTSLHNGLEGHLRLFEFTLLLFPSVSKLSQLLTISYSGSKAVLLVSCLMRVL